MSSSIVLIVLYDIRAKIAVIGKFEKVNDCPMAGFEPNL